MIRLHYHPTPNPAKVAPLLEEAGLPYEAVPIDTMKGGRHAAAFRAVKPHGKVPAIVDTRVFAPDSILHHLAEKAGRVLGSPADRGELLSWLSLIASGLGPFPGRAFRKEQDEEARRHLFPSNYPAPAA